MTAIAVVAIGRNEGARLEACLASLSAGLPPAMVIYVDSGSTDGSVEHARAAGAQVVELDMAQPFTAARARNAGAALVPEDIPYIQFIDADCTLDSCWLETAADYLDRYADIAVVCGRRRERHPDASVYNRLCDAEWNTPVGRAKACGGDALMRLTAFRSVGGFDPALIAGEEPELCVRLRADNWQVWRLDAEMTRHDANLTAFSQFWRRARRSGHAFAEGAARHGAAPERHNVTALCRVLFWGLGLPVLIVLLLALVWPLGVLLVLAYPAQIARMALREGGDRGAWERAALLTVAKFAEARGALEYYANRLRGRGGHLIEYK